MSCNAEMRSLEETGIRWEATFAHNSSISDLRTAIRATVGESPCINGLRSICWKAFLLFENLDKSTWTKTLSDSRSAYASLKEHFLRDIEHPEDLSSTDPLTDDESSPWYILRQDEDLRAEILQDVERCMPENLYFREPPTQAMLLDILFIFCKLNRDIGYRQGMHEVLAPILWVISRDAIDPTTLGQDPENPLGRDDLMRASLSEKHVEHDAFTLFSIVMQTVKSFYEMGNIEQASLSAPANTSPIVERSKRIHERYLRQADLELAEHLIAIEVLPQIFLIRWIRLLFGREFPFDEVLTLWDVLFAEDPTLDLVDMICVSMLLRIRWQLIEADYSAALTLLLRYPAPSESHGPPSFVADALYLRDNPLVESGPQIVLKYSKKLPSPPSEAATLHNKPNPFIRKFPKKGRRIRQRRRDDQGKTESPGILPAKFLQDQGGIEGILQEAAKGVYSRGEKWGVARALRGAVQGLQSGMSSPRKPPNGLRLSQEHSNSFDPSHVTAKLRELEQRNKALAKLLEHTMEDLWAQQKDFTKAKAEPAADALSLAIAKLHFVQVYLENSTMPFPAEHPEEGGVDTAQSATPPAMNADNKAGQVTAALSATEFSPSATAVTARTFPDAVPDIEIITSSTSSRSKLLLSTPPAEPKSPTSTSRDDSGHLPFHQPRPSLAQSSFSWMLGEDLRKSSFVSAKPFPSEKRNARGKAGYLFGDDNGERKPGIKASKGSESKDEVDEEVISLGDLNSGAGEHDET